MKRVLLLTTSAMPMSVLLAVLGVVLFDGANWGLNVPLFTLACYLTTLSAMHARDGVPSRETVTAGLLAVCWAGVFIWRDSPVLHWLAGFAIAAILYCVYLKREFGMLSMPVSSVFTRLPPVARAFALGPLCAIRQELYGRNGRASMHASHAVAIARGVALSVPLLVVFGWLLISADTRFAELTWRLLDLDFVSLLRQTLVFSVCFWIAIFLLRARVVQVGARSPARRLVPQPLEVVTALVLLDALLAIYMAVQSTYFVGGDALVRSSQPLTYAQYARQGFFELLAVAGLTVPLLLVADWVCEKSPLHVRAMQRVASMATTALIMLIGFSAAHRLALYTQAYGLTELRLYAGAALIWTMILLVWIAWTLARNARERFLAGAFVSALSIIAALVLINPDARIAQINLARAASGQPLDVDYLLSLSADAVPAIATARGRLPRAQRMSVEHALFLRRLAFRPPPWQGWNWAQVRANRVSFAAPAMD